MSPDKCVLVADDDPSIRLVLSKALTKVGYKVTLCANGHDVKKHILAGEGDVLLTDVLMPDMNGIDLIPFVHLHMQVLSTFLPDSFLILFSLLFDLSEETIV